MPPEKEGSPLAPKRRERTASLRRGTPSAPLPVDLTVRVAPTTWTECSSRQRPASGRDAKGRRRFRTIVAQSF